MDSKEPELVSTFEDGVRILRFNRPKKKNALNGTLLDGIKNAFKAAEADPDTHIVVITGTGDYFSSGNDLGNFTKKLGDGMASSSNTPDTDEGRISFLRNSSLKGFEEFMNTVIEFPKPIIAVVNGPAVGMAVTLLALFDVVYASERATFHTPFVSTAQSPEGCSSYLFPRIMGPGKAAEMLIFSRKISAADACRHGLVTEVFPDDSLGQVWPRIREWAKLPPNSMVNAKSIMRVHNKDFLMKVNDMECDRLAVQFTKDEFTTALMNFFNRKSKL